MHHPTCTRATRRGSTMILVVSMLVLLVIIAAAFVSRTQAGRVTAGAQQLTAAQSDRVGPIAHAVTEEIAQSLFVRPINPSDAALNTANPALGIPAAASSAVPRLLPDSAATRYSIDPLDRMNNGTGGVATDGNVDGYNYAPYEVRPWTNWPDTYNTSPVGDIRVAEANPVGNAGFGDARWLRSTEPVRVMYQLATPPQPPEPVFSHWAHLSWIPTANNGWRITTNIADIEANTLVAIANGPLPAAFFPTPPVRYGLEIPYEQWLPSVPPDPTMWVPITIGAIPAAPLPPYTGTIQADAALIFKQLAFGTLPAANPVGGWFSSDHPTWLATQANALPNFLRLKWFGPKADEFVLDSPRNIISRTLCDTDGDGFTDSFWFLAPNSMDRSIRHVVGVSVIDNCSMLNVNIATRSDPATTAGKTPSDLALVSRLEPFATTPNPNPEVGFLSSSENDSSWGDYAGITVDFDRFRFGSPLGPLPADFPKNTLTPTFLSELGVVKTANVPTAILPFSNFLKADWERTNYFKAMSRGGEVEGYFEIPIDPLAPPIPHLRSETQAPAILDPFTMTDELELRAFAGQNNPYVRTRLERALEVDFDESDPNNPVSWPYKLFLRSAMHREETSEFYDQLDALQLLHDNRRKLTTVSGARNDLMPPWLWTTPPVASLDRVGLATWTIGAPGNPGSTRGWRPLSPGAAGWDLDLPLSVLYFNHDDLDKPQGASSLFSPNPDVQFPASGIALQGDGNCDTVLDQVDIELARKQFLDWNKKVDLNRELSITGDGSGILAYWANEHDLARDIQKVLHRSLVDFETKSSVFGSEILPAADPNLNRFARIEGQRAAASWTANILAALDGPRQFGSGGMLDPLIDHPLPPSQGIRARTPNDGSGGWDPDPGTFTFIGQEKHPFIVQVFFAVVYPNSPYASAGERYVTFNPDRAGTASNPAPNTLFTQYPDLLPQGISAKPDQARIVLAVQIANPYSEPIDLFPFSVRAFGQVIPLGLPAVAPGSPNGGWGYGMHPMLGPATEEGPSTAVIFAIPKSLGDPAQPVGFSEHFRVSMLNFLDLTHPWMRAGNPSIPTGSGIISRQPNFLQGEISLAMSDSPAVNPFPAPTAGSTLLGHDLYEDTLTDYADSLVINASKQTDVESVLAAGANKWSVLPRDYAAKIESGDPLLMDIAILRLIPDPAAPGGAVSVVVDRLDNEYIDDTSSGTSAPVSWLEAMERMVTSPGIRQAGGPGANVLAEVSEWCPPVGTGQPPDGGLNPSARVKLEADDFLMTWVRVSRPWVMDVDRNGAITANERSPRFVFANSNAIEPRWASKRLGIVVDPGQQEKDFFGGSFTAAELASNADAIVSERRFDPFGTSVLGKPTNFTQRTTHVGGVRTYASRESAQVGAPWPGVPGGAATTTIFGDTGDTLLPIDEIPDFYKIPLRMVQRDGPFEQVGEVLDVPVWGPILTQAGTTWTTHATFGELLVGETQPAMGGSGGTGGLHGSDPQPDRAGFRSFALDQNGIGDSASFRFNRARQAISPIVGFFPPLPAGASILDGFTLDGAGMSKVDTDVPLNGANGTELLTAEERRLRLAGGFTGAATQGLININTAPIEVMRALPQMQQLSYNYEDPRLGDGVLPLPPLPTSFPKVRVPESIVNYRDRYPANINGVIGMPDGPKYDDRGFVHIPPPPPEIDPGELFPFHPGMRGERGFVSVGELALLDREYHQSTVPGTDPVVEPDPEFWTGASWEWEKSWSLSFAGRDPYRTAAEPLGSIPPPATPSDGGSGWRAAQSGGGFEPVDPVPPYDTAGAINFSTGGFSAQLSTERTARPVVAGDQIERNALLKGIANIVTTRSDVFTVYLKVRSVAQNSATGKWDATDPLTLVDESRYILVVDRSEVDRPGQQPKILMFEKIQE